MAHFAGTDLDFLQCVVKVLEEVNLSGRKGRIFRTIIAIALDYDWEGAPNLMSLPSVCYTAIIVLDPSLLWVIVTCSCIHCCCSSSPDLSSPGKTVMTVDTQGTTSVLTALNFDLVLSERAPLLSCNMT
jgi:hypothetical protein